MKKTLSTAALIISIVIAANCKNEYTIVSYAPAPGQFINELLSIAANEDSISIAKQVDTNIKNGTLVSLGGFGGHIIVKLDKKLQNHIDEFDFTIYGNAFEMSAEPGVVMVSCDDNNNALPDDEWFELAGSEYSRSLQNYSITYHKPTAEHDNHTGAIEQYIKWTDNQRNEGWLPKNIFHTGSYYPLWIKNDKITYSGTLVPDNSVDKYGNGSYIELPPYQYGYVDNKPNRSPQDCSFKIDWAKTFEGKDTLLTAIDFIKVHTGVHKVNPNIGEVSTEITGIELLHVDKETSIPTIQNINYYVDGKNKIVYLGEEKSNIYIIDIYGRLIEHIKQCSEYSYEKLSQGMYFLKGENFTIKFITGT